MNICCVTAHPDEESLTVAAAGRLVSTARQQGAAVCEINLYKEGFDPLLGLPELRRKFPFDSQTQQYIQKFQDSKLIVLVYPEWWGGPPAILKGLLDRVLRPEIAYGFTEGAGHTESHGLWADKSLQLVLCSDSTVETATERAECLFGSISDFCAIKLLPPQVFAPVYGSSSKQRRQWLDEIESYFTDLIRHSVQH
ncbi:NAD(P)H-dependent oxidoreductase [Spirochaeta dissipatitropha]